MRLTIAAFFILLFTTPCAAEIIVTERDAYFTISGRTQSELLRSIQANSPRRGKKNFALAQMRPKISYSIERAKHGDRCGVDSITIHLDITYLYPRPSNELNKRTKDWFDDFSEELIEHEQTHGIIAKRFADKIEREVNGMNDLNCSTMTQVVHDRVNYLIRKMNDKQDEYDRLENLY